MDDYKKSKAQLIAELRELRRNHSTVDRGASGHPPSRPLPGLEDECFRRFFDLNMVAVMFWHADGRIIEANRAFCDLVGYTQDEVRAGRIGWVDITPPGLPWLDRPAIREINAGGHCHGYEKQLVHRDGRHIPVLIAGGLLGDVPDHGLAFAFDLTRVKNVEKDLEESEKKFETLFHSSPEAMALASAEDGRVQEVNETCCRFLGYAREEILGKTLLELGTLPHVEERTTLRELLEARSKVVDFECHVKVRSGEAKAVLITVEILRFDGRPAMLAVVKDITGRKAVEEELGRSLARERERAAELEALMDSVPGVIWITRDPESRSISGNRKAHEILGLSKRDNLSKSAPEAERPVHFKALKDGREIPVDELPVQMAARGIEVRDYELELLFEAGELLHLFGNATPLRNPSGEAYGAVAAFVDITGRKRSENILRKFELLAANSRDIILFMRGGDGRILEANAAAVNAYGYSREELLNLAIQDLRAPGTKSAAVTQRLEAEQRGILFETVHRRRDGSTFPVEVSSRGAIIDGIHTLVSVVRDITERKQAEGVLRRSEARFKLLSDTAGRLLASGQPRTIIDGLCRSVMDHLNCDAFFNYIADKKTGRLRLNAYAGIPEEEARKIEYLDYGEAVCGRAASDACCIIAEDILHSGDVRTELVKSYGIQAYSCHPLMVQGRPIGTLSFGTKSRTHFSVLDLAVMKTVADQVATAMERVQLIEALEKSRDELESHVVERTAELAKTVASLEATNQELQDFAYIASHDLQEPLRKIQAFGGLLRRSCGARLNDTETDYLSRMDSAAARMRQLIHDLLNYSRVRSMPSPFEPVHLEDIAREVLQVFELNLQKSGGTVRVADLPRIEADPTQMKQLLQNLIGNALKFQPRGAVPLVRIYCEPPDQDNTCRICVEDNGIGFDPAYLDRIFAPFQRLHGRREYEGTGMGLAICRKIVDRHEGSLTAKSTPGKGSIFILTLPVKHAKQAQ